MIGNLFRILVQPRRTLDRLLEQRRYSSSWWATWLIIGVYALVTFLFGLYLVRSLNEFFYATDTEGFLPAGFLQFVFVIAFVFLILYLILYYVGARFVWSWMVQLGLRISAGRQYPTDPQERREKARLLRLVHPYTTWLTVLPALIGLALIPLFFDFDFENWFDRDFFLYFEYSDDVPPEFYSILMGFLLYGIIFQVIMFGMTIYMIIVRTMAIMKIYQVTASQAFWGPFLIYFLLYVILYGTYFVLALMGMFIDPTYLDPRYTL